MAQLQFVCIPLFQDCLARASPVFCSVEKQQDNEADGSSAFKCSLLSLAFIFFFFFYFNELSLVLKYIFSLLPYINCAVWTFSFTYAFCFCAFSRQQLTKMYFESPPISPKTPYSTVKCKTSRERGQKSSSTILSNFFQKKHKTTSIKEAQQDVRQGGVQNVQNVQTHNPNDFDLHSGKSHVSLVVKEEPVDVEDMSTMGLTSVKLEDTASHSRSLGFEMAHSSSLSTDVKPIIKGEANSAVDSEQCIIQTF